IYFTDKGVIVEQGEPKAFFSNPQDPRTREFLDKVL
ncbi:MAG: peptide ABC transporter ATP-binding protein, partial [Mesorhizobium sp.]